MNRLIQRATLLSVVPTLLLSGCPYWGDYDYGEPYAWCQAPGTDPAAETPPEVSHTPEMAVIEKEVAIIATAASTSIEIPIDAAFDFGQATVTAFFQAHGAVEQVAAASTELSIVPGRLYARIETAGIPESELLGMRLGYTVTVASAGGDVAWLRGWVSVSESLRSFRIHVAAPGTVTEGGEIPVRVFGTTGGRPEASYTADVQLLVGDAVAAAAAPATDAGVASATVRAPAGVTGAGELVITATPAVGRPTISRLPVTVVRGGAILVTADKPRYQPGQTMHLRIMALHRPDMKPVADTEVLVEIADGKGYKVFKEPLTTNAFGIAHTTFTLASEVNMGTYAVTVTMGDEETVENLVVERYQLPRFNVDVSLDRDYVVDGNPLTGSVNVRYTFGEPAAYSTVSLELAYGDGQLIGTLTGAANEAGVYAFELPVQLGARADSVKLTVEALDTAGQKGTKEFALKTADQGIGLWMVPARDRVAGEPWKVYVVARDPAGRPVEASGMARLSRVTRSLTTNRLGIAEVTFPADAQADTMTVALTAADGLAGTESFALGDFAAGIALQTDQPRYAAGDTASVAIQAPQGVTTVGVDLVVDGRVVASHTVDVGSDGADTLVVPMPEDADGVVLLEAFAVNMSGQALRGRTAVYVQSVRKLNVAATLDKASYLPGETARVDFAVTDRSGEGVPAALGLVVVDEAVYALQSFNPTTYGQFLSGQALPAEMATLVPAEQSLELLEGNNPRADAATDLAARALLAAAAHRKATPDTFVDAVAQAERTNATAAINAQLSQLGTALNYETCTGLAYNASLRNWLNDWGASHIDPWGQRYATAIDRTAGTVVQLRSAGPDETMNTDDDITSELTLNGYWN